MPGCRLGEERTRKGEEAVIEFLQAYGTWIILAGLFILMLQMHLSGGGCELGSGEQDDRLTGQKTANPEPETASTARRCH